MVISQLRLSPDREVILVGITFDEAQSLTTANIGHSNNNPEVFAVVYSGADEAELLDYGTRLFAEMEKPHADQ